MLSGSYVLCLLQGIVKLQDKIAGESLAERYATPGAAHKASLVSRLTRPMLRKPSQ